jgi:hypothetical protein
MMRKRTLAITAIGGARYARSAPQRLRRIQLIARLFADRYNIATGAKRIYKEAICDSRSSPLTLLGSSASVFL